MRDPTEVPRAVKKLYALLDDLSRALYFVYLIPRHTERVVVCTEQVIHHAACRVSFDRLSAEYLSVVILKCEQVAGCTGLLKNSD